jgi:hypothetical protein
MFVRERFSYSSSLHAEIVPQDERGFGKNSPFNFVIGLKRRVAGSAGVSLAVSALGS